MVLLPGNFLLCNPLTATVVAAALGYAPTSTMIASGQPLWFEHAVCVCVCVVFQYVVVCYYSCSPVLTKLYIVWVVPSGHDFEVSIPPYHRLSVTTGTLQVFP